MTFVATQLHLLAADLIVANLGQQAARGLDLLVVVSAFGRTTADTR